eukprot:CAMPEP_0170616130 /NCGR_PEP_ID=MMETSP0224-20130122/25710_1 /TAXON_ID=285029 /ORGANISM="Togula jolla, Strain CCCM 725" /LENGTH=311 /DNA_ID=CAMNT_0010941915 /DNA_START=48 /DNA_END=983 /DNA_ORIENTATION=-
MTRARRGHRSGAASATKAAEAASGGAAPAEAPESCNAALPVEGSKEVPPAATPLALLGVPSPARNRRSPVPRSSVAADTEVAEGQAALSSSTEQAALAVAASVSTAPTRGPEPWGLPTLEHATSSSVYRDQLRASGHVALLRLWQLGITPRTGADAAGQAGSLPPRAAASLPSGTMGSAGEVLTSLDLMPMPPTSPAPHLSTAGRPCEVPGAPWPLPGIALPATPEPPQWAAKTAFDMPRPGPMPPMPPPTSVARMVSPSMVQVPPPSPMCGGGSNEFLDMMAVLMPGSASLDSSQIAHQLQAAAQCTYDD